MVLLLAVVLMYSGRRLEIILVRHRDECHVRVEVDQLLYIYALFTCPVTTIACRQDSMHPNNPYAIKKPDFAVLASKYPSFAQ